VGTTDHLGQTLLQMGQGTTADVLLAAREQLRARQRTRVSQARYALAFTLLCVLIAVWLVRNNAMQNALLRSHNTNLRWQVPAASARGEQAWRGWGEPIGPEVKLAFLPELVQVSHSATALTHLRSIRWSGIATEVTTIGITHQASLSHEQEEALAARFLADVRVGLLQPAAPHKGGAWYQEHDWGAIAPQRTVRPWATFFHHQRMRRVIYWPQMIANVLSVCGATVTVLLVIRAARHWFPTRRLVAGNCPTCTYPINTQPQNQSGPISIICSECGTDAWVRLSKLLRSSSRSAS
jgi:hypothetical protein